MTWSSRRAVIALATVASLGAISLVGHALAQKLPAVRPIMPTPPPGGMAATAPAAPEGFELGDLTLPKDEDLAERVEAATDNIIRKDWATACKTLQELAGRTEDVFVPIKKPDAKGVPTVVYASVKKEASRLIGSLPKPGRDFYEATYGPQADAMVRRAKEINDFREMALALSLYLHTDAGIDAATWLGSYMLDRAEFQGATRFYQTLLDRAGVAALKDPTLLKAAYAFHSAGDRKSRDAVLGELTKRGRVEFKLRDEVRTVADVRDSLDRLVVSVSQQSASDSPIYRGRPARSAMLPGGAPFLEPAWKAAMAKAEPTRLYVRGAEDGLRAKAAPVLSAFSPVTATASKGDKKTPLLIYRSWWGIHAVNVATGETLWDSPSDLSLDVVHESKVGVPADTRATPYRNFISAFTSTRPQILLENSVLGTLSADAKHVYAVEDLPVPPPAAQVAPVGAMPGGGFGGRAVGTGIDRSMQEAVNGNKLQAFSLAATGKLVWEVGGPDPKSPLGESFFLSPPLPVNNRLYVVNEKQQELRLVALDPATGKVLSVQPLATTKNVRMTTDPLRRTQAAHLAYSEGILVIPTNAGAVFGVDVLNNSLLWASPYREGTPKAAPAAPALGMGRVLGGGIRLVPGGMPPAGVGYGGLNSYWQVTAPVITDGKVVFTGPDDGRIHCVSLREGTRLWTQSRKDDDMYLAGAFNAKAVVVGRKTTRALDLAKGGTVWELETGEPSGQGAASNATGDVMYYLPVRHSTSTGEPEVVAINVDRGLVHAHTRSRKKEVPGNLLFFEGSMLSQSHHEVVSYPQIEVQLAKLEKEVSAEPTNADKLTERGDYLLDKGDLGPAIADFRKALKNGPKPETRAKARGKLFDAFTEYFQRDFSRAEEYLAEYEEMCKVDLAGSVGEERSGRMREERRRRANFLCLVGKGREAQGRLADAFDRYLELGEGAKHDELIQVVDEPSVKAAPDVWSQGRIGSMVANAKDAGKRLELETKIKQRWEKLGKDAATRTEDVRRFVALFGSLFAVGREARFALAERLIEETEVNALLEAEQQLAVLRADADPAFAARAVEALARLNTRKGLLEDAAFYYRQLGERFPDVAVTGKKGAEYLDDLATDKRFLPFLDQGTRSPVRGGVHLRRDEKREGATASSAYQLFNHSDAVLPYFVKHKVGVLSDYSTNTLVVTDTSTGEKRSRSLDRTRFNQIVTGTQHARTRLGYQTIGHTVVVQLGHRVFGIDPLGKEPRVLWSQNLSQMPNSETNPPEWASLTVSPKDGGVTALYSDGSMTHAGAGGPLAAGVVCLARRDSLTAIDPVTGRELWVRTDIGSRTRLFSDDSNVYVVSLNDSGNAAGTRVFRAHDGVSVKADDFSDVYNNRVRVIGRTVVTKQTERNNAPTLRVHDVLTGKDLLRETFPVNSTLLESEDPDLAGVVDPTGAVKAYNVRTLQPVLTAKMEAAHVTNVQSVGLVADADHFYLAVNQNPNPMVLMPGNGGLMPNVQPGSGLRTIPVNGQLYAFERAGGKKRWEAEVPLQHLVVSDFEDMPALFFAARYLKLS
ncbi:MAG: PQQ-binding-like beta-propeller repeat protein, partial [Gemmataceae bacterium]